VYRPASAGKASILARLRRRLGELDGRLQSRRSTFALAAAAAAFAVIVGLPGAVLHFTPDSDGLFYEVQKLEIEGHGAAEATAIVFHTPMAQEVARLEDQKVRRVLDPAWVTYSSRFYRRRWLVPAIAAGLDPIVHHRTGVALRVTSYLGYVLLAPALFLLLRRRFSPVVSVGVAAATMLAPPVYRWSIGMWLDSWSLVLETLAILAAVLVKEKGRRWLLMWTAVLVALSVTRDASVIILLGIFLLLLVERRDREKLRTNLMLLGSGVAAALPVFLLGGAPVRENLAYIMNDYRIPPDDSWGFVASNYLGQIRYTIEADARYPFGFSLPVEVVLCAAVVVALAGIAAVLLLPPAGDFYHVLAKSLIPGCIIFLLIAANAQAYRLELVFLPVCVIGIAIIAQRLLLGADPSTFRRNMSVLR
jgi:Dolichyl-phosphate-mannose-protein mannosyltransferase